MTMVPKTSGDEIVARGATWTVVERRGSGYDAVSVEGESSWIADNEIRTEPQSELRLGREAEWMKKLQDEPLTVTARDTVAGLLTELEQLAVGLDADASVIINDFIEQKREELGI